MAKVAKKAKVQSVNGLEIGDKAKILDVSEAKEGQSSGSNIFVAGFVAVGIPWTEEEFLDQATKLTHPFDWEVLLPPKVARVISHLAAAGPDQIKRYRLNQLEYWKQREASLRPQEEELHKRLHPDVERVVASKNVLLFKEMLEEIGYDDMAVVDLLISGVQVIGTLDKVGIWKPEDRAALISKETLLMGAKAAQIDSRRTRQVSQEDEVVWQTTMDEVQEGCLDGPFSPDQLSEKLGQHWVPEGAPGRTSTT